MKGPPKKEDAARQDGVIKLPNSGGESIRIDAEHQESFCGSSAALVEPWQREAARLLREFRRTRQARHHRALVLHCAGMGIRIAQFAAHEL